MHNYDKFDHFYHITSSARHHADQIRLLDFLIQWDVCPKKITALLEAGIGMSSLLSGFLDAQGVTTTSKAHNLLNVDITGFGPKRYEELTHILCAFDRLSYCDS